MQACPTRLPKRTAHKTHECLCIEHNSCSSHTLLKQTLHEQLRCGEKTCEPKTFANTRKYTEKNTQGECPQVYRGTSCGRLPPQQNCLMPTSAFDWIMSASDWIMMPTNMMPTNQVQTTTMHHACTSLSQQQYANKMTHDT